MRRGFSLNTLSHKDPGDIALLEGDAAPSLKQIMETIHTYQSTLTKHIDGTRAEISFLKQDVQNIREKATEAEQRISDLEDEVRPLEGTVQNTQREVIDHADELGDMEDH